MVQCCSISSLVTSIWLFLAFCLAQALEDVEEALVRLENLLQKLHVCRSFSEKEQLKAVFDESSLIICRKFSVILCSGTTQLAAQRLHRLTLHQKLDTQIQHHRWLVLLREVEWLNRISII